LYTFSPLILWIKHWFFIDSEVNLANSRQQSLKLVCLKHAGTDAGTTLQSCRCLDTLSDVN